MASVTEEVGAEGLNLEPIEQPDIARSADGIMCKAAEAPARPRA
jgi:hypothetical protein